jgi:CRISPR-associated exonuclease Cas4
MSWGLLFFALLGIALAVWWLARRSQARTGLPSGRLVYADTTHWRPVERPLFSRTYRLTGRPDYLVWRGPEVIPVEIKSGRAPRDKPYTSHVLQLAAYCLLVEEAYGLRPPHGIIVYSDDANRACEVDYTSVLEEQLISILDKMRCAAAASDVPRDHNEAVRCRACSYRMSCDQSLV